MGGDPGTRNEAGPSASRRGDVAAAATAGGTIAGTAALRETVTETPEIEEESHRRIEVIETQMRAREAGMLGAETRKSSVATKSPLLTRRNLRARKRGRRRRRRRRRVPSTRRRRLAETGASLTETRRMSRGKTESSSVAALATVEKGTTDTMDPRTATEETGGATTTEEAPTTTGLETSATENRRTAIIEARRTTAETLAIGQGTKAAEAGVVVAGAAAVAASPRATTMGMVRGWHEKTAPALPGPGRSSGNIEEEAKEARRTTGATAAGL